MSDLLVIMPCGPGAGAAVDTLESVRRYCGGCEIIVADDHTTDGTYEAVLEWCGGRHRVLRNAASRGVADGLSRTLADAYAVALRESDAPLVLRLDQDALLISDGLVADAIRYATGHPDVGLFGVYERDYDRPRTFDAHERLIARRMSRLRRAFGRDPWWRGILEAAERNGYARGENVFGGAYFMTRRCLEAIQSIGGLDVPEDGRTGLQEDVYYSMATVAAGLRLGHFAAPDGPLCLEWRGLPYPAVELAERGFKLVHSVDKGQNTGPLENRGLTAREVFRKLRKPGTQAAALAEERTMEGVS